MPKSIECRLAYLVSPRSELFAALGLEADTGHELSKPVVVVTALLDYEEWFEGRKRHWASKAKADFIADTLRVYADEFPRFADELRKQDAMEAFDKWWMISLIETIDIDPAWRPS